MAGFISHRGESRTAKRGGNRKRGPYRLATKLLKQASKADGIFGRDEVLLECGHKAFITPSAQGTRCTKCRKATSEKGD